MRIHFLVFEVPQTVPVSTQQTKLVDRTPAAHAPEPESVLGVAETRLITQSIETERFDPKSLLSSSFPTLEALRIAPRCTTVSLSIFPSRRRAALGSRDLPIEREKPSYSAKHCSKAVAGAHPRTLLREIGLEG